MKDWKNNFRRIGSGAVASQTDWALERSCAGRIINALTFIFIIICLGLWITAFLLLKNHFSTETLADNVLTNLTCISFFGGLAVAIFVGALAGNILRRIFWRILIKRK